jgi:ATP phosphoribosyltransferase
MIATSVLGIPSKGRLMEACIELFAKAGLTIDRTGSDRGYRGKLSGIDNIEIAFLSASEIARICCAKPCPPMILHWTQSHA